MHTHTHKHVHTHEQAKATVAALPRGFRFAVSKAADEQAHRGVDKQIYDAAKEGKFIALLDLCQQWSSHPVIDAYKDEVS